MNELTREEKVARLHLHIRDWQAAQYDAEVNAKVGKVVGDEQIVAKATAGLSLAIKALDVIEAEIAKLTQVVVQ